MAVDSNYHLELLEVAVVIAVGVAAASDILRACTQGLHGEAGDCWV